MQQARQQQRALEQASARQKLDEQPLPELPENALGQTWVKRINKEENKIVWLPTNRNRIVDPASGRVKDGDADTETLIQKVEVDGFVRRFTPPSASSPRPQLSLVAAAGAEC